MKSLKNKVKKIGVLAVSSLVVFSPLFSDSHMRGSMMEDMDDDSYEYKYKYKEEHGKESYYEEEYEYEKGEGYEYKYEYRERYMEREGYFRLPMGYIMNASKELCERIVKPVECKVYIEKDGVSEELEIKANNRCLAALKVKDLVNEGASIKEVRCEYEDFLRPMPMPKREEMAIMCPAVYAPVECEAKLFVNGTEMEVKVEGSNKCFAMAKLKEMYPKFEIKELECELREKEEYYEYEFEYEKEYKDRNEILEEIMEIKAKIRETNDPVERKKLEMKLKMLEEQLFIISKSEKRAEMRKIGEMGKEMVMEKIRELKMKKEEIRAKVMEREEEIKVRINELKERLKKKLQEQKRLDESDKQEIFDLIKETLAVKLEKLELRVLELLDKVSANEEDLIKLLETLQNDNVTEVNFVDTSKVEELENLLLEIDGLKVELENAATVVELKELVKAYLEIRIKLKVLEESLETQTTVTVS